MQNGINGINGMNRINGVGFNAQCTHRTNYASHFKSMPHKCVIKWIIYSLESHFQLIEIYTRYMYSLKCIEFNLLECTIVLVTENKRSIASNDFLIIMEEKKNYDKNVYMKNSTLWTTQTELPVFICNEFLRQMAKLPTLEYFFFRIKLTLIRLLSFVLGILLT